MANAYVRDENNNPVPNPTPEEIEAAKAAQDAANLAKFHEDMTAWKAIAEKQKRLIDAGRLSLALQVQVPERPTEPKSIPR